MVGFLVIGLFGIFFCLTIALDKLLDEIFKSDIGNIQKDIYDIKMEIERIERKIDNMR